MKKLIANPKIRFIVILFSLYACALAVAFILYPENLAFKGPNPNPYYFMAIFIASFYGIAEAATASVIANIIFFTLLYLQADFELVETIFDLDTVMTASLFSALAILIGELRTMGKAKLISLQETIKQKEQVLHLLTSEFENNLKNSEELKNKLLSKIDTFSVIYNDSKKLNALEIETIIEGLVAVIVKHLSASKCAVYFSNGINDGIFHLVNGKGANLQNAINISNEQNPQIVKIVESKKCLVPEDVWSKSDFTSLHGKILMGAPLVVKGNVRGMVLIYELPFLKYVPFNFRLFEIYAHWASESLDKALHFQYVEQSNIVNKVYDVYKWDYFCARLEEEFDQSKTFMLPLSIAKFTLCNILEDQREIIMIALISVSKNIVRKMDCVAEGPDSGGVYILMRVADEKSARGKIQQIENHFPKDVWAKITVDVSSFSPEMQSAADLLKGVSEISRIAGDQR